MDGEPRTATSTFTQLLISAGEIWKFLSFNGWWPEFNFACAPSGRAVRRAAPGVASASALLSLQKLWFVDTVFVPHN